MGCCSALCCNGSAGQSCLLLLAKALLPFQPPLASNIMSSTADDGSSLRILYDLSILIDVVAVECDGEEANDADNVVVPVAGKPSMSMKES